MALPGILFALTLTLLAAPPQARVEGAPALESVVIDPGHGGADFGANGPSGLLEKDLALALAGRIGHELEHLGIRVVYTRERDAFVSLAERTAIANRAEADLLLSVHANAAEDAAARGFETYFVSLEASDSEALQVAMTENRVFDLPDAAPDAGDIVGGILGDLIRTEHLRASSLIASSIQRQIGRLRGGSRGVKQAPFAVLMGVNMPAVLVEVGFLTHSGDEQRLRRADYQRSIARALADALAPFRPVPAAPAAEQEGP